MPADAGDDCTDCTVCTVDDNDDMSEIVQLDGCDSVSTSSTDSHSDTLSSADISSPSLNNPSYSIDNDSYSVNNLSSSMNAQDNTISSNRNSPWCDSEESSLSVENEGSSHRPQPIPVVAGRSQPASQPSPPPWFEEQARRPADLPYTRKTVRRDNRLLVGATLPTFSAPNCRSIEPKLSNIVQCKNLELSRHNLYEFI